MPVRGSSAAASPINALSPPARLGTPDVVPDTHSLHEFGGGSFKPGGQNGEQKIISALVGRLVNKVNRRSQQSIRDFN